MSRSNVAIYKGYFSCKLFASFYHCFPGTNSLYSPYIKQQTQFEAKLEQEKEKHASAEAEIEEVRN